MYSLHYSPTYNKTDDKQLPALGSDYQFAAIETHSFLGDIENFV